MRDIRQDLKERIAAEHARREPLLAALKEINDNVASLERLVALEEGRATTNGTLNLAVPKPTANLEDFLMKMLAKGPTSLEELREAASAAGYFEGSGESPGRTIFGKLLNHMRAGTITRGDDKVYRLTK